MLTNLAITTAVTAKTTAPLQLREGAPESITLQANFAYGSGGTSVSAWVQTSLDGGATWADVSNFSFTTSSAREAMSVSSLTTATTPQALTDGTLAANTATGVPLGTVWRVKYTSVGTYAGSTTLRIDATPNRGRFTSLS
jgi:hypothetical protein